MTDSILLYVLCFCWGCSMIFIVMLSTSIRKLAKTNLYLLDVAENHLKFIDNLQLRVAKLEDMK